MSTNYDWVEKYIGKPWVNPAAFEPSVQNGFDCLSLVTHIYKEHLGIAFHPSNVPVLVDAGSTLNVSRLLNDAENFEGFTEIDVEQETVGDFDIVIMKRGIRNNHIGVMVGKAILHSVQSGGVLSTRPARLFSDCGLSIDSIWRHESCLK